MSNNNKKLNHLLPRSAFIVIGVLVFGTSLAAEIGAEFRAGFSVSDNIFLSPDNGTEDSIWTAGMSFNLTEQTSRVLAEVEVVADYLNYDETFESETAGAVDALVEFMMIDEYLTWMIRENYGQRLSDPLGTPNPGNRENVNFFTTGPNLQIPFGSRNLLNLDGRYSSITYEESQNDNERVSALLQFERRSNAEASFTVNVGTQSVTFDNDSLSNDFDVHEAYFGYEVNSARNLLDVQLGYTKLDVGFDTSDGYLVRLDWTRISSETYSFLFSGGSQYSTQGDIFRFGQGNGRTIGGTLDVEGDDTPFRSHFFYTRYNLNAERTRLTIEMEWNQDDYDYLEPDLITSPEDRDVLRAMFLVERDITRSFYVNVGVETQNRKYQYIEREDDDLYVYARLGYRFSDAFNMFVSFRYLDRESNDINQNYTENRATIGFAYIPSWGR